VGRDREAAPRAGSMWAHQHEQQRGVEREEGEGKREKGLGCKLKSVIFWGAEHMPQNNYT
jgi:hypothetical protein